MKAIFTLLAGLGIGAALMYLFDPNGGNRRRALIRDKATKFNRKTREAVEGTMEDLSNRAKGTMHELKSAVSSRTKDEPNQTTADWSQGPAI